MYWAILVLLLRLLCVTSLVGSSYSIIAPPSPSSGFSSCWQRGWGLYTHTLILKSSPSMSHQPQKIHIFADSKMRSLHQSIMCFAHVLQDLVLLFWMYANLFEPAIAFVFYYCTMPPCNKIDLCKLSFLGCCPERLDHAFVLLSSLIFLFFSQKSSFLSDDHSNSSMYNVWLFMLITVPFDSKMSSVKYCWVESPPLHCVLYSSQKIPYDLSVASNHVSNAILCSDIYIRGS